MVPDHVVAEHKFPECVDKIYPANGLFRFFMIAGKHVFPDNCRNGIKSVISGYPCCYPDWIWQSEIRMNSSEPTKRNVVAFGESPVPVETPGYLHKIYWWAYEHPLAVRFWDHGFLINFILLGNYDRLVNAVLDEFSDGLDGDTLQISCAYGKLTPRLENRLNEGGRLDVIDVLKVQLENVRRKLKWPGERVRLIQCDATRLNCPDASYDQVLMFFLPHELPGDKRRQALSEAVRVVKPGGKVILVEFHRPKWWHPLRLWQRLVFLLFEPFATDMWRHDLTYYLPEYPECLVERHETYFGDLYQKLVLVRKK